MKAGFPLCDMRVDRGWNEKRLTYRSPVDVHLLVRGRLASTSKSHGRKGNGERPRRAKYDGSGSSLWTAGSGDGANIPHNRTTRVEIGRLDNSNRPFSYSSAICHLALIEIREMVA